MIFSICAFTKHFGAKMSDEKKLPQDKELSPEDEKTCEDAGPPEDQEKDRLLKEILARGPQINPRPIPTPYEGTLEFSTFSATSGLEIFPIPPPPPQISQQPVFRQSIPAEFATASLNQPTDTPNLLPSHPGLSFSGQYATTMDEGSGTSSQQVVQRSWSRESTAEVTANQPLGVPSQTPSQTLATQSSHGQLVQTVPIQPMTKLSLKPSKSVIDGRSPAEGMELRLKCDYEPFLKSIPSNIVPKPPPVTERSNDAQMQVSEAAGQDDLSSGIQHSGKDDGKYASQPQGQPVSVIQHTSMRKNVQDTESKKAEELSGHASGFDSKDYSTEGGKSSDMQNVAMDSEKNAEGRQETMEEPLDCSMPKAKTSEDKPQAKQRPKRRSKRSKSQKKR